MSEYKSAFFVVPSRILELPGLILSYLRVYETIFQFLNKGNQCYLSNKAIKKRTGISSVSTVKDALVFFEKHGELKRKTIKGQRYFVQPERSIKTENTPAAKSATPGRQVAPPPAAKSAHNNKKLNNKNINKEKAFKNICAFESNARASFDEFWNVYPKKKDKKKACQIWIKLGYDKIAKRIIDDVINRNLNEESWKTERFIPHPSTYLRNERWDDALTLAQSENEKEKESGAERAWRMCTNSSIN
ncbi:MAG TPA: hypothetical protein VNX68_01015 [Nitrosopumilaceae archaeon]|nr:hypothetical protein [Nitrosopumilaceae archaeon]